MNPRKKTTHSSTMLPGKIQPSIFVGGPPQKAAPTNAEKCSQSYTLSKNEWNDGARSNGEF
jgi:hypothetical protein